MTEKDYNPEQRNKKVMEPQKTAKQEKVAAPKAESSGKELSNKKIAESQSDSENKKPVDKNSEQMSDSNKDGKKTDDKKTKTEKKAEPKPKKSEAVVRGVSLPISTKKAVDVCRFIKGKTIHKAISDLEKVIQRKSAVPMKGELPHQKGKLASGGYPKKTSENFVKLLRSLRANANDNGLTEPVITEVVANMASRPYGRFGRVKRKRTHVMIKVNEKKAKGGKK